MQKSVSEQLDLLGEALDRLTPEELRSRFLNSRLCADFISQYSTVELFVLDASMYVGEHLFTTMIDTSAVDFAEAA